MRAVERVSRLRGLLEEQGLDAIIVRSTTDLQWLTGFEGVFDEEQAHTAVVTAKDCVIHTDSRYSTAMRRAAKEEDLWKVDDALVTVGDFVQQVLHKQALLEGCVAIDDTTPLRIYRALSEAVPQAEFAERSGDILGLRAVKSEDEVDRLKAAQEIADEAFLETIEGIRPGQTEAEVSLKLEFAMRSRGAQELAFPNIVASGPNSANPHSVPGQRRLQTGDMVVIDFGARKDGYRSDTTRTVCLGEPNEFQRSVYDAVLLAQTEVKKAVHAGVTGHAMHDMAEEILAQEGFKGRMGHGLGHGVGLDIHELPNLNTRNDRPLPEGAIVTVEPGVYIPGICGVRIEDYGRVTKDGFDNFCSLTHELICL